MQEFGELLRSFGWPGAILIVLGIAGWRGGITIARFLKDKFLDDDIDAASGQAKGIIPKVVAAHLSMVAAVQKTAEDNSTILMAQDQTNREILMLVREGREDQRATKQLLLQSLQGQGRIVPAAEVPLPPIVGIVVDKHP